MSRAAVGALLAVPILAAAVPASAGPTDLSTPSISVETNGAGVVGSQMYATATVSNDDTATGGVTFTVYPPGDPTCTGSPAYTSTISSGTPESAGTTDFTSDAFVASHAGAYNWIASYSGDASDSSATTDCGDFDSTYYVSAASPSVENAPATGAKPLGSSITNTVSLLAGYSATGSMDFALYGPTQANCAGTPIFTSSTTVDGNGVYDSHSDKPTTAGTYHWIATYGGDDNNNAAATICSDVNGAVTINAPVTAASTITLSASKSQLAFGAEKTETLTATVASSPTPSSGTVTITTAGDTVCSFAVTNGAGSCSLTGSQLSVGHHNLNASYAGNTTTAPSATTADLVVTVSKAAAKVGIRLNHAKATYGKENTEKLSVAVASVPAGLASKGTVTITDGSKTVCTIRVKAAGTGACKLTKNQLKPGKQKLKAHYSGNATIGTATKTATLAIAKPNQK
jgi:Bacterial Ig-like domain (group 3)